MIVIFEPVCVGSEHAMFNAGLIAAASQLKGDGRIIFMADDTHLAEVRACLSDELIEMTRWHSVCVAPRHLNRLFKRLPYEWKLFSAVLLQAENNDAEAIIGTGITEAGLLAVKCRLALSRSKRPVLLVFHSILQRFLYSIKRRFLVTAGNPKRLAMLVLGDYILNNLLKVVPQLSRSAFAINHPYLFSESLQQVVCPDSLPRFAFLGVGNRSKGFEVFLKLVSDVVSQNGEGNFVLVGWIAEECLPAYKLFSDQYAGKCLTVTPSKSRLDIADFRRQLKDIDYAILPFEESHYRWTCSGSALDAIYAVKPIIGLRTSHLIELFDKMGDIGYICTDYTDMLATVLRLSLKPEKERYEAQCRNIIAGRSIFSPTSVAGGLESTISNLRALNC